LHIILIGRNEKQKGKVLQKGTPERTNTSSRGRKDNGNHKENIGNLFRRREEENSPPRSRIIKEEGWSKSKKKKAKKPACSKRVRKEKKKFAKNGISHASTTHGIKGVGSGGR